MSKEEWIRLRMFFSFVEIAEMDEDYSEIVEKGLINLSGEILWFSKKAIKN
jgi:hypothetical protein